MTRVRAISCHALLIVPALFSLALAAGPIEAARLPGWAQAIADAAPPVLDGIPEHASRVLYQERHVEVLPFGRLEVRDRLAKQALGSGAEQIGFEAVRLGATREIVRTHGWHLPPGERARKSRRSDVLELSTGSGFISDERAQAVTIDGIERGSLVFFELVTRWDPYTLSFSRAFAAPVPVDESRLEIVLPEGWRLRSEWLHEPGPEAEVLGALHRWTLRDLEADDTEPLSDSAAAAAPTLAISLIPPENEKVRPEVFTDWSVPAAWITSLLGQTAELDPAAAGPLLDGVTSEPGLERVLAVARRVRDRVRYVAKVVGIGGYQPRPAAETLATLWGDCKDKGTLLRALLARDGLITYPILVNNGSRDTVAESVPTLDAFNHFIVGVRLTEGLEPAERTRAATLLDSPVGPLLILDVTDEATAPGWMPSGLAGHRALLIDGTSGHLITLPGWTPADHGLDIELDIELLADGRVLMTRTRTFRGEPARWQRIDERSSSREHHQYAETALHDLWVDAELKDLSVQPETPDGLYIDHATWTLPSVPTAGDTRALRLFPGADHLLPRIHLRRRTVPVVYGFPRRIRIHTTVRKLPGPVEPPASSDRSEPGWSLATTYSAGQEPGVLTAHLELRLEDARFPKDRFSELGSLFRSLASAARARIQP